MEKEGVIFAILSVAIVLILIWFIVGVMMSMSTEKVNYSRLAKMDKGVEIRQYENLTLISTTADDTNSAFSTLARYISGNNRANTKIEMTAPVISHRETGGVNMSFILPHEYDLSNAPEPGDNNVKITELSSRKLATITFSGYVSDSSYEKHRMQLEKVLKSNGIVTKGEYFLMRYNPPWIAPTMMRNEIAVEVE